MRLRTPPWSPLRGSLPAALRIVCEFLALDPMRRSARRRSIGIMRDECLVSPTTHSRVHLNFRDGFTWQPTEDSKGFASIIMEISLIRIIFGVSGRFSLFALLMLAAFSAHAVTLDNNEVTPSLVKDITGGISDSDPEYFENVNGTTFFAADDGGNGRELWKSDGTFEGTVLVKDIWPGPSDSNPRQLTNVDGTLFFVADDGVNGRELWKSDGTETGTVMVRDIGGEGDSWLGKLTAVGSTLYFSATHIDYARELWKSDGTEEGTVLVKDINPGGGHNPSDPDWLTDVNGTLFFQANDGVHGTELWKSDGTEAGTVLVKDISTTNSDCKWLTNVGGTLFFAARDSAGDELWKSDGSEAGTVRVKDIHEGTSNSSPVRLRDVNGLLLFSAFDGVNGLELWRSDGTEAGTFLVKDINPGPGSSQPYSYGNHISVFHGSTVVAGDKLFFRAYDGTPTDTNLWRSGELWVSDGTEEGTFLVKNIHPDGESRPSWLTAVGDNVFFNARDGVHTDALFFSDGTEAGTGWVEGIHPDGSAPRWLTNVEGTLMFEASDGNSGHGSELWKAEVLDGNDDEEIGLAVACLHNPIYPPNVGDQVTITATTIDDDGNALTADLIEIWVDDRSWPTAETQNQSSLTHQFQADNETFSYACHAARLDEQGMWESHFSRWRTVDVGSPEIPKFPAIPALFHGPFEDKIDIVFFFDQDEYTGFEDLAFHQDIDILLRDGLFTVPWFVKFQHFFNFWIGKLPGNSGPDPNDTDASDGLRCLRQAPSPFGAPGSGGYAILYPFADAGAIVHRANCRDNAGSPGVFTIEADANPQVFAHEMGHRPFGLADEYCCGSFGGYYRNEPFANLYGTEANCLSFALIRGFDPLQCRSFVDTRPMTPEDWWIWEPSTVARDLMQQNGQYKVGDSEIDRMIWMIERCLGGEC